MNEDLIVMILTDLSLMTTHLNSMHHLVRPQSDLLAATPYCQDAGPMSMIYMKLRKFSYLCSNSS